MTDDQTPLLDIFILSYNRADYLRATLESIFAQSWQRFSVTVLDNASTDNTRAVVEAINAHATASGNAGSRPVRFEGSAENIGALANFFRIKQLARAPWVMAFHDDDLLHPQYLERAFALLEADRRCNFVSGDYVATTSPSAAGFTPLPERPKCWHFKNSAHFASFCFTLNKANFAACIYRTETFRKIGEDMDAFGKVWDRPAMIDGMGEGTAIVLQDSVVQYRTHAGQDSQSGPSLEQAIALTRYYRTQMGDSLRTSSGRSFVINNRAYLKGLYKWCRNRSELSFGKFVAKARAQGAATRWSRLPRPLMRIAKKICLRTDSDFF